MTLPDYQGMGLGTAISEAVGDLFKERGVRVTIVTSHPAMPSPLLPITRVQIFVVPLTRGSREVTG